MPVCHLNKGTSENLFVRMNESDVFYDPQGWLGKKAAPERRYMAKQTRVTVDGERKRQEPNRPSGPANRGRPRDSENPERLNT